MTSFKKELDGVVRRALAGFIRDVNEVTWIGRENEAVNLFVFSHLLREIRPGSLLRDPSQIGIEVAVPQLVSDRPHKKSVRKDLVIWPEPKMTSWDKSKHSTNIPLAVLEWKAHGFRVPASPELKNSSYDLEWLTNFSKDKPNFAGYSIALNVSGKSQLICTPVYAGMLEAPWKI